MAVAPFCSLFLFDFFSLPDIEPPTKDFPLCPAGAAPASKILLHQREQPARIFGRAFSGLSRVSDLRVGQPLRFLPRLPRPYLDLMRQHRFARRRCGIEPIETPTADEEIPAADPRRTILAHLTHSRPAPLTGDSVIHTWPDGIVDLVPPPERRPKDKRLLGVVRPNHSYG